MKPETEPSWLHEQMNAALARRRIVVHAKYSPAEAAEARAAADAAATAAAQAKGIGGGPVVVAPPGENWGDAIRSRVLGG